MARQVDLGVVVVLTALDLEYAAVRAHLVEPERGTYQGGTGFEVGTLVNSSVRIALGLTGEGVVSTAVVAERAITTFKPRALLYVGVAGGLKDELRLGDVVVASRVYAMHSGKQESERFLVRPRSWEAPHELLDLAHHLARSRTWDTTTARADQRGFMVYVKPIAVGDVVIDSRDNFLVRQLHTHYNDAVAIEMEGAGAVHAGHLNHRLPVLVVRGISDRADGAKHTTDAASWQPAAAANAAAFALALVREWAVTASIEDTSAARHCCCLSHVLVGWRSQSMAPRRCRAAR